MLRWLFVHIISVFVSACTSAVPTPATLSITTGDSPTTLPPLTQSSSHLTPVPLPTLHTDTTSWVEERLDAVIALYQPTTAGEALLRSIDLRQMKGEPGYFGSYGFSKWAGVGEASPIGVIHELGHSYWGGFPVTGQPNLSWKRTLNNGLSTAMQAYHRDILTFMAQPPDDFELLRQRLRNLPNLSSDNPEPLFHHLEADIPYTTGGSLKLVPPILRKYWDNFLPAGRFIDWYEAAGWFQSLSSENVAATGKWLGFEHLDIRQYPSLEQAEPTEPILAVAKNVLDIEERQRLRDLTYQFDLLIGDPQNKEDFDFWRRYLLDKIDLYKPHSSYLLSLSHPRAVELNSALAFLSSQTSGTPLEKSQILAAQLSKEPFLVNFLPAVDNQVLVELFSVGAELPTGETLQATASFVERLKVFSSKVESVLNSGKMSPAQGAAELEVFINQIGLDHTNDLKLFFDLLRDKDPETCKLITSNLPDKVIRNLMTPVPNQLRAILGPEELLPKLGITSDDLETMKTGIALLINEPSGNFRIDEPFLKYLYWVMADKSKKEPGKTARIMLDTPFPLEGFISAEPEGTARIFAENIDISLALIQTSDPLLAPAPRIIYKLIKENPGQAAYILTQLYEQDEIDTISESLAHLAYDKDRLKRSPQLPISMESNVDFLTRLLDLKGEDWLETRLSESVNLFRMRSINGEVSPDFLLHYRESLEFIASIGSSNESRRLAQIIRHSFEIE